MYTDYNKALSQKMYLVNFKVKRFDEFEEAKIWTECMYEDLQEDILAEYEVDEMRKINWTYYRKRKK